MLKRLAIIVIGLQIASAGPPPYPRMYMSEREYGGHIFQLKSIMPNCNTFMIEKYRHIGVSAIKSDSIDLETNYRVALDNDNVTIFEILHQQTLIQIVQYKNGRSIKGGVYRSCKI